MVIPKNVSKNLLNSILVNLPIVSTLLEVSTVHIVLYIHLSSRGKIMIFSSKFDESYVALRMLKIQMLTIPLRYGTA